MQEHMLRYHCDVTLIIGMGNQVLMRKSYSNTLGCELNKHTANETFTFNLKVKIFLREIFLSILNGPLSSIERK